MFVNLVEFEANDTQDSCGQTQNNTVYVCVCFFLCAYLYVCMCVRVRMCLTTVQHVEKRCRIQQATSHLLVTPMDTRHTPTVSGEYL